MDAPVTPRWRLALFSAGDFAFNLYWQSVMLYLLFYYTEALHLPLAIASLCYAIASAWDGVANLFVGILVDRYVRPDRMRLYVAWGAVPLGLSFVIAYAPPPGGNMTIAWAIASHLLFRTCYAIVNVPYLAMSARISVDSGDRALVTGGRMIWGTVAAVIVAIGTVPLGRMLSGTDGPAAYAATAAVFAAVGSLLLLGVGATYRDGHLPPATSSENIAQTIRSALVNRAFVTLNIAVVAMIVAVTVLDKSVLYYFKYALGDEAAGQLTLGWMMAVSGAAVPLWVVGARLLGARSVWFVATAVCLTCLALFGFSEFQDGFSALLFLVVVQVAMVGLHFAFWALLPDTVEYGQQISGIRSEAVLYGIAALLQRMAIGLGTLLVGYGLGGDQHHAATDDATYRFVLAVLPAIFFALAGAAMLANPLRKGSHDRIVEQLASR